jgi:hypothetical protein
MIFHAFRTLCKIGPNILAADYEYFKNKNAYDSNTKWYIPAKVSHINHKFANYMEKRIKKSVSKMVDSEKLNSKDGGFRNKL